MKTIQSKWFETIEEWANAHINHIVVKEEISGKVENWELGKTGTGVHFFFMYQGKMHNLYKRIPVKFLMKNYKKIHYGEKHDYEELGVAKDT